MQKQKFTNLIKELTSISPRRGKNEHLAAELIKKYLTGENISFIIQEFPVSVPVFTKAELVADSKNIPCLGASFVSGNITNDVSIQESFEKSDAKEMVIYNPKALGVCLETHKEVPAVAIKEADVSILRNSKTIYGKVEVKELEFQSQNILIGNIINPKKIVFAHYDSIVGSGAVDDAAAVDTMYQVIISNKSLLKDNLFVFAGCEEESISSHDGYYGYEVFDKEYPYLLNNAKKIIVIDGVGVGEPKIVKEDINWVFDIPRLKEIESKIFWMQNDQSLVMPYYHSMFDTLDIINSKYIESARDLLISELQQNL